MKKYFLIICILLLGFSSCSTDEGVSEESSIPTTAPLAEGETATEPILEAAAPTDTLVLPTATAVPPTPVPSPTPPLTALVNSRPILLADYENALLRYEQGQAAVGLTPPENYREEVFISLVKRSIIEQAAAENGITIPDEVVESRINEMISDASSQENFDAWLAANQLTPEEFPQIIRAEILADEVEMLITADVPYEVEQVRASYIQVADEELARSILAQVQNGADFAALAQAYSLDPTTANIGGDLGFFHTLLVPELQEAAFSLEIGGVSNVISVPSGTGQVYHYIITVTEKDSSRPLEEEQRSIMLIERFESWMLDQLARAEIVRFDQ